MIIAASSEHRQEAINVVTFAIDALKSMATIWKKVSSEAHISSKISELCLFHCRKFMLMGQECGKKIKNALGHLK